MDGRSIAPQDPTARRHLAVLDHELAEDRLYPLISRGFPPLLRRFGA